MMDASAALSAAAEAPERQQEPVQTELEDAIAASAPMTHVGAVITARRQRESGAVVCAADGCDVERPPMRGRKPLVWFCPDHAG